jgi:hypothetical protein
MKVLQINQDSRLIILGYCLVLCERIIYLIIWVLLEKKWQKNYPSPFSNREGRWDRILCSQCLCHIKLFKTLACPIIHEKIFTFKNRSIDDNFLFYLNLLFICCIIHLLLIILGWHHSLAFGSLLRTSHLKIK